MVDDVAGIDVREGFQGQAVPFFLTVAGLPSLEAQCVSEVLEDCAVADARAMSSRVTACSAAMMSLHVMPPIRTRRRCHGSTPQRLASRASAASSVHSRAGVRSADARR